MLVEWTNKRRKIKKGTSQGGKLFGSGISKERKGRRKAMTRTLRQNNDASIEKTSTNPGPKGEGNERINGVSIWFQRTEDSKTGTLTGTLN